MPPFILRLAYVSQFLLALLAVIALWEHAGGAGHLDLMPWYTKLGLTAGMALVTVMGTASAVAHERAWNAKTIACLLLAPLGYYLSYLAATPEHDFRFMYPSTLMIQCVALSAALGGLAQKPTGRAP